MAAIGKDVPMSEKKTRSDHRWARARPWRGRRPRPRQRPRALPQLTLGVSERRGGSGGRGDRWALRRRIREQGSRDKRRGRRPFSGRGHGVAMEEIQVTMDQLTKSQAMIAKQLGMAMVAIESAQGSTKPPATPTKPNEKQTPQESPTGVDEVPSNAQSLALSVRPRMHGGSPNASRP